MTVLRLARSELKRMTGGLLPKLTILALAMVPLLYGAVYLYANWDPYGKLNQIDAALVVQDSGATSADGTRLEAGRKVAESLVDAHNFNWQTVSSAEEADQGVSSGKYAFALKIPRGRRYLIDCNPGGAPLADQLHGRLEQFLFRGVGAAGPELLFRLAGACRAAGGHTAISGFSDFRVQYLCLRTAKVDIASPSKV